MSQACILCKFQVTYLLFFVLLTDFNPEQLVFVFVFVAGMVTSIITILCVCVCVCVCVCARACSCMHVDLCV